MKSVLAVFLLVLGIVANPVKRCVDSIASNLMTIDSDIKNAAGAVASWDGSASKILPVQRVEDSLNLDVNSTKTATQQTPSFDLNSCTGYIQYLNGTIEPNLAKYLQQYPSKRSIMIATNSYLFITRQLNRTRTSFAGFFTALVPACSSVAPSTISKVASKVDGDYIAVLAAIRP